MFSKPLPPRIKDLLTLLLLTLSVLAVYCPPALLNSQNTLVGSDYAALHSHRIQYFQENFPHLPSWYTREAFGTPYWANIQSFPWNPFRLLILPFHTDIAHAIGINLCAIFSALFTYLYLRTLRTSRLASALASWTFACSGYYASRVMAGHLPLLEAYPLLPLLLYLLEKIRTHLHHPKKLALSLLLYSLATAGTALSGHPQLPAYIIGTSILYTLLRFPAKTKLLPLSATLLGIGTSMFAWLPMLSLLRRTMRFLPLDPPGNNIYMEYGRLHSLFQPWKDGWPPLVNLTPNIPFTAYPNHSYFWDTVCYFGWLPILAATAYSLHLLINKKFTPHTLFFLLLGSAALLTTLPFMKALDSGITIFRSPVRQLYLTIFFTTLLFAYSIDHFKKLPLNKNFKLTLLTVLLLWHTIDLYRNDTPFIRPLPRTIKSPQLKQLVTQTSKEHRLAFDLYSVYFAENRQGDDIGYFDSAILARPYSVLNALAGKSATHNAQDFLTGFDLDTPELQYLGVKYLITHQPQNTPPTSTIGYAHLHQIPNPHPRISFYPPEKTRHLPYQKLLQELRTLNYSALNLLTLESPPHPTTPPPPAPPSQQPPPTQTTLQLQHQRPSPDQIQIQLTTPQPGHLQILESWDPGWSATLNQKPIPLQIANGFAIAIPVAPGTSHITLTYHTPLATQGLILTLLSLTLLIGGCILIARKQPLTD